MRLGTLPLENPCAMSHPAAVECSAHEDSGFASTATLTEEFIGMELSPSSTAGPSIVPNNGCFCMKGEMSP